MLSLRATLRAAKVGLVRGDCYIWGLPDMCRWCKSALASGEPNLNPALCYPAATVDDIKDLPLRALLDRHVVGRRPQRDCARIARVDDLPAEPTTPHSEVVNASPREPEVDRDGTGALAEDSDEGWRRIQRVLDGSAWDDPDRSGM